MSWWEVIAGWKRLAFSTHFPGQAVSTQRGAGTQKQIPPARPHSRFIVTLVRLFGLPCFGEHRRTPGDGAPNTEQDGNTADIGTVALIKVPEFRNPTSTGSVSVSLLRSSSSTQSFRLNFPSHADGMCGFAAIQIDGHGLVCN